MISLDFNHLECLNTKFILTSIKFYSFKNKIASIILVILCWRSDVWYFCYQVLYWDQHMFCIFGRTLSSCMIGIVFLPFAGIYNKGRWWWGTPWGINTRYDILNWVSVLSLFMIWCYSLLLSAFEIKKKREKKETNFWFKSHINIL